MTPRRTDECGREAHLLKEVGQEGHDEDDRGVEAEDGELDRDEPIVHHGPPEAAGYGDHSGERAGKENGATVPECVHAVPVKGEEGGEGCNGPPPLIPVTGLGAGAKARTGAGRQRKARGTSLVQAETPGPGMHNCHPPTSSFLRVAGKQSFSPFPQRTFKKGAALFGEVEVLPVRKFEVTVPRSQFGEGTDIKKRE